MAPTPPHDARQEQLIAALVEWLTETALEMRRVREEKQKPELAVRSRWNRFWAWWDAHGKHLSGLSTIIIALIGGLWTINEYLDQQRFRLEQEANQRRQQEKEQVSRFAMDLIDASKRNMAAALLALQAGESALQLLVHQVREAVAREDAADFRSALAGALVTVGPAGLGEAVRLNREASSEYFKSQGGERITSRLMVETTQEAILSFLLQNREIARSNDANLDGIHLINPSLRLENLSGIRLRDARIYGGNLCSARLQGADLSRTRLYGGYLLNVDLSDAHLDGTWFSMDWQAENPRRPYMNGATLDRAQGQETDFEGVSLEYATLRSAVLPGAKLQGAHLEGSDLTNADLTGADLMHADLTRARLSGVHLAKAQLSGSNLYEASLAGADLDDAVLWPGKLAEPFQPGGEPSAALGAFVLGADFTGATGLSEDMWRYLCRFGAHGVPGGCEGVPKEQVSPPPGPVSGFASSSRSSCR